MKLAFIGYGALGRYIEAMITESLPAPPDATVYFDDKRHQAAAPSSLPFAAHTSQDFHDFQFYVCLGYKHLKVKKQVIDRLLELGRTVPHHVHPSAYVHPSVHIGSGSMIYPGCSIDRNAKIGNATWITNASVVAHDSTIGDACWLGATVTVSGHVTVGDSTFIASGTTIANDIAIGAHAIIGVATAVTKNVADHSSVIGNPMRILDRPLRLV